MKGIITITVRLIQAVKHAYMRKGSFLGVFAVVFLGSAAVLGQLDLLPAVSPVSAASTTIPVAMNTSSRVAISELPVKIEIPRLSLSTSIVNPTTTEIAVLDQDLLLGAVRYPTSAKLGEEGNVVLFGHSSYLPIVNNKAYKTFNNIQKLVAGDVVTVYSSGTAYTYRVQSVAEESADNNTAIPLSVAGKVLTLITCNSFGTKADRFVVTADFVESHSIST